MNASVLRGSSRAPSEVAGEPVGIDVTPVMNVFIILIPFLVSMAVFSHLAVHGFSLPGDEGSDQATTADQLPITVALAADRTVVARGEWVIAETEGRVAAGRELVAGALRDARNRYPEAPRVVVAVDDPIRCDEVVACLDLCRDAGWEDVGIAAGTNLDRGEE